MIRAPSRFTQADQPLYLTDEQLRPLISPQLTLAAFLKNLTELEMRGFPKFDPVFKGRYWPAVRSYLDRRAGIGNREVLAADGEETWDDETQRVPRVDTTQARRLGKTILERGQPHEKGGKIPRPVDPFTQRRHGSGNP